MMISNMYTGSVLSMLYVISYVIFFFYVFVWFLCLFLLFFLFVFCVFFFFFFFQAEDGIRDGTVTGSSDVCSSDLANARAPSQRPGDRDLRGSGQAGPGVGGAEVRRRRQPDSRRARHLAWLGGRRRPTRTARGRSEERRVGKEGRAGGERGQ